MKRLGVAVVVVQRKFHKTTTSVPLGRGLLTHEQVLRVVVDAPQKKVTTTLVLLGKVFSVAKMFF